MSHVQPLMGKTAFCHSNTRVKLITNVPKLTLQMESFSMVLEITGCISHLWMAKVDRLHHQRDWHGQGAEKKWNALDSEIGDDGNDDATRGHRLVAEVKTCGEILLWWLWHSASVLECIADNCAVCVFFKADDRTMEHGTIAGTACVPLCHPPLCVVPSCFACILLRLKMEPRN